MGYSASNNYYENAVKRKKKRLEREQKVAEQVEQKRRTEELDHDSDSGDFGQPPDSTSDDGGEVEGGLSSSREGQVLTFAQLLDMEEEPAYDNLEEMEDAEESYVSWTSKEQGRDEEDMPMELDNTNIPSAVAGLPPPNNDFRRSCHI
jgi:hypothetical protein